MDNQHIKSFVIAGNSTFTLYSSKIDKRFTYKVQKGKDSTIYFVKVMFGPDNENDYRFLGWFYIHSEFPGKSFELMCNSKSCTTREDLRFRLFNCFINMVGKQEYADTLHFYPSGKCGRCGRTLTTPESIERGIGPECAKMY